MRQVLGSYLPLVVGLLYPPSVSNDIWVGALTTLIGAAIGGGISFALSRQQLKDARLQRMEQEVREERRRSADRRFHAYSDFLTRARSYRNAVQAYYLHPNNKPSIEEIDALDHAANDASSDVFLLVESEDTLEGCIAVLEALSRVQAIIQPTESSTADDPWTEINAILGRSTREFQNSARKELGVVGPLRPWIMRDEEPASSDFTTELKAHDTHHPDD